MKNGFYRSFLILIFQLLSFWTFSQNSDTVYFNEHWQICPKSFATYYRLGTTIQSGKRLYYVGNVHDYYLNGKLQMEGTYLPTGEKEGLFSLYYPNGKLQLQGSFDKNKIYGMWSSYYPSGAEKAKVYYRGSEVSFTVMSYFDSTGNQLIKNGSGKFEINVNNFLGDEQYRLVGEFLNGMRVGTWNYYSHESGVENLYIKEIYENDEFKSGTVYGRKGKNYKTSAEQPFQSFNLTYTDKFYATEVLLIDEMSFLKNQAEMNKKKSGLADTSLSFGNTRDTVGALRKVEIDASFPGGVTTWRKFLEQNLKIDVAFEGLPKKVKKFTQTVVVEFVVCTDGEVCEVKTANDVYPSLAKEAERVIKLSSGFWIPAVQDGKNVKAFRKQPITFIYEEE